MVTGPALSPAIAAGSDRPTVAPSMPVQGGTPDQGRTDGAPELAGPTPVPDAFDPTRRLHGRLVPGLSPLAPPAQAFGDGPRLLAPHGGPDSFPPAPTTPARPGTDGPPTADAVSTGSDAALGSPVPAADPMPDADASSAPTRDWTARFATPNASVDSFQEVASGPDGVFAGGSTMEPGRGFQATAVRVDPDDGSVIWQRTLGGNGSDGFEAVTVHDGTVYLGGFTTRDDFDLLVVALDAETGRTRWRATHATERDASAFDLAVTDDGSRVVATGFAMDRFGLTFSVLNVGLTGSGDPFASAGRLAWIREMPTQDLDFVPSIDVSGGRAYVATETGTTPVARGVVRAYDATTGAPLWTDVSGQGNLEEHAVAVEAGPDKVAVVFAGGGPVVHAYEPTTGERLWSTVVDRAEHAWLGNIELGRNGIVYVAGRMEPPDDPGDFGDVAVVAFDGDDGSERWRQLTEFGDDSTTETTAGMAITQGPRGHLYVAGFTRRNGVDRAVLSLDADDGSVRWTRRTPSVHRGIDFLQDVTTTSSGRVAAAGVAWGGPTTFDGHVQVHDPATGNVTASRSVNGPAPGGFDIGRRVALSPDGDAVFVAGKSMSEEFKLRIRTVAYDADDGAQLWSRWDPTRSDRAGSGVIGGLATGMEVGPDGAHVYTSANIVGDFGGREGLLLAQDVASGDFVWNDTMQLNPDGKKVESLYDVAVGPDGATVYAAGFGKTPEATGRDAAAVAVDAATGDRRWTWARDLGGDEFGEEIEVADERAYVVSDRSGFPDDDAVATALDRVSGTTVWNRSVPDVDPWEATLSEGVLVVAGSRVRRDAADRRTSDAVVTALDASDGSTLWNATFDELDSFDLGRGVTVADGRVVLTGRTVPKQGTATGHAVNGDDVFVAAYDLQTGTELWTATANSGPPEAVRVFPQDRGVDVGVVDGTVLTAGMAFDLDTGWDQLVLAHDAATGEELDRWRIGTRGEDVAVDVAVGPDRAVTTGWSSQDVLTVAFEP